MSTPAAVNEHYLDHVVALSETSDVEASEDIVSGSGLKLMAKGAKIDARARERLLQHKLTKPLESMMRVVDGVATRQIDRVADALLSRHPLLSRLCGGGSAWQLTTSMRNVMLSPQVESLLTVYASQGAGKLEHAVGIALLSAALVQDLPGTDPVPLMIAGLVHDVGELYIDPAYLAPGVELAPQQWKHIATHPIVGSRVLAEMAGAGPQVALAVLHHHERFNGFGYPHGAQGDSLSLPGQALAVAEMLMGVMERGGHHAERAAVAMRLVPGEFSRVMLDRVIQAARAVRGGADEPAPVVSVPEMLTRLSELAQATRRFNAIRGQWAGELPRLAKPLRDLLTHVLDRFERIRVAFSSTGLDSLAGTDAQQQLEAMDTAEQLEMSIVLRELQWRMRELERQATVRSENFSPADAQQVRKLLELTTS
jgi:hypothetical protein